MTETLEEIEERHGFKFGVPDEHVNPAAVVARHVKCDNSQCERSGAQANPVPIHDDTVVPVFCGGCGAVLYCDHQPGEPEETVQGTLSEPSITVTTRCVLCHETLTEHTYELEPVRFKDLPAAALVALGVPFVRTRDS